jgi:Family of unknown function (DUF5681)
MDDISNPKRGKRLGPKTDSTDAQQKPWLFKPGQSGNPTGRPKGSRNKLAEDFLADAYQQWQQCGSKALETMAKEEPAKFCQMVANLLPKESVFQDERVQISEIKLVVINPPNNTEQKTLDVSPGINNSDSVPISRPVELAPKAALTIAHKLVERADRG